MYAAHRHPIQVLSLQYSQSATDAANRNGMPHSLGIDLCDNLGQQAVATIGIEPSPFTVGVDLEKMDPSGPSKKSNLPKCRPSSFMNPTMPLATLSDNSCGCHLPASQSVGISRQSAILSRNDVRSSSNPNSRSYTKTTVTSFSA